MDSILEEMLSYSDLSDYEYDEYLMHYGMPRRSGRYPWGSGDQPYQHSRDFLARIEECKKNNFTYKDPETGEVYTGDKAIYKSMGLTSSEYRRQVSWAGYEKRLNQVATAKSLREDGLGYTEIGRKMDLPESTVRSLLNPKSEDRMHQAMQTVDFLRAQLEEKGMIDVGTGVERELNISKERLDLALDYLEKAEGCPVYKGGVPQPTNPGQQTNQRVLCLPGTKHSEIYDYDRVKTINDYISRDSGESFEKKFHYPSSLDSKRLKILLKDEIGPDGEKGVDKDGIIQIRPGVEDLSLGNSRYAQVRILVDGNKYLKGMAVYSDNMPDGIDVIFNSNKTSYEKALKNISKDPDNPFGSLIKDADQGGQYWYTDKKTGEKKLGLINKRADEGDWSEWADALPSQFLGKQSISMAKKQLNLDKADKLAEFDEICSLTNPTIKKHLLEKFADNCDSAAVHLKAAALPGQKYHAIIPINTLNDNEVYAPNYENGTKLALIRYPHGGLFEIPILTVNNKNKTAIQVLGKDVGDAVGINKNVAERLSGADFDGDTVMCIPTHDSKGKVKISNKPPLKELEGFDNKLLYGAHEEKVDADGKVHYYRNGVEYPIMKNTGTEMGKISNLITDMTLAGASDDKLARAVKHSMVVIDAEKHKLDYKQSEIDNNIAALKKEYQPKENGTFGGAATLLSRAKGQASVDKRQGSYKVNIPGEDYYDPTKPDGAKLWKAADDLYYPDRSYNKNTGKVEIKTTDGKKISYDPKDKEAYKKYNPVRRVDGDTGEVSYTNDDGSISYKLKKRTQRSTKMAETDDANTLVSVYKHPMELVYSDYANSMKALGNQARIEMKTAGKIEYSSTAKNTYKNEVASLNAKLNEALLNTTRERAALRMANAEVADKKAKYKEEHGTDMKTSDVKKASQQAVSKYRQEVGSITRKKRNIEISDREWEAIQAGAITETVLKKILNNTDIDKVRERATPRTYNTLSDAQVTRIKALSASNYTLSEIANKLGVSSTTVSKYLKGGN